MGRFIFFLRELQRRHVFKSGVAYLVVAWLIVQVLSILIPAFNLPYGILQFSIVILMAGFPVWLVISWIYDLTEDGIVRTQKIDYDSEVISKKSVNLNKIIISALSIVVVILVVNTIRMKAESRKFITNEELVTRPFKSSVAVLAFADMSPEHNQEYFADGMSEEILNRLARHKELRVIGRTSSFSFKDRKVTLDVIGKELDVAYILEGSVRQSGDIFRITVQLIDVKTGGHIWSETFDRKVEDALYVQDEIAERVASLMKITLLNEDLRQRKLDPRAYDLFLKAQNALNDYQEEGLLKADTLIRKSIEIDETYAPAWNILAQVLFGKTYYYFHIDTTEGYENGLLAAQRAVEIDSSNAMGYVWQSLFAWQNQEADVSAAMLQKALEISPNDPSVLEQAGNFALRTNRLEEAEEYYDRAILLDPKSTMALNRKGFIEWTKGNIENAEHFIERAYALGLPNYLRNYELALLNRDKGNYDLAQEYMEKESNPYLKDLLACSINYAMGNEQAARSLLETIKKYPENENREEYLDTDAEHFFEVACLSAYMGDKDQAFDYLDLAFEHVLIWPEWLFSIPEFTKLEKDPRWDQYVSRLGEAYNFNFLSSD